MNQLIAISGPEDILPEYRQTPIGKLLEYHNLDIKLDKHSDPHLLIGMCMDNRIQLRIPYNYSLIIRAGGANMKNSGFNISFAIAVRGIQHIALIGHNHCGMINLNSQKELFIEGLVRNAGWEYSDAEDHFLKYEPICEIFSEIDFILSETKRLRLRYPSVSVAPMLYKLEDNLLYLIKEH